VSVSTAWMDSAGTDSFACSRAWICFSSKPSGIVTIVTTPLPSRRDVSKCVITKETITKGLKPTLVTSGGAGEEPDELLAEESA
jgi:hypothetical protein